MGAEADGTTEEALPAADGNALGVYVPLADSAPLASFYAALRRLEEGSGSSETDDGPDKVRVAVYGASHTAADVYTSYLRAYLHKRFGDGGLGYVSLVPTNRWYGLMALDVDGSKGWTTEHAQRSKARDDGYYGLLGASVMTTGPNEHGVVTPRARAPITDGETTYDIYFLKQPSGGSFSLKIGDARVASINTRARDYGPGYYTVTRAGGPETVEVRPEPRGAGKRGKSKPAKTKSRRRARSSGEIRLFGMVLENDSRGVVVDTLGISGTRASNHLEWDEALWRDNFTRRAPALYILAYGTNEATDANVPISHYREGLTATLARFKKVVPEASCLLVGPGDYQRKVADDVYEPVARITEIAAVQREVAAAQGCAYWDMLAFMGGVGAIDTWARAEPQMAKADHIHLTKRGYLRMGMALTDAIMDGFDNPTPDGGSSG